MPSLFLTRKHFSSAGSPSTQTLLFSLWPNPKTRAWVDVQIRLSRRSWGVILESAWSVFLAGVETGETGPLGWWSSERLGWVSAGFQLRFCCGFRSRWVWFDFGSWFDLIWFDLILGLDLILFGFGIGSWFGGFNEKGRPWCLKIWHLSRGWDLGLLWR